MSETASLTDVLSRAGEMVTREREHAEDLAARIAAAVCKELAGYEGSFPVEVEARSSSNLPGTTVRVRPQFPGWLKVKPQFSMFPPREREWQAPRLGEDSVQVVLQQMRITEVLAEDRKETS